MTQSSVRAGSLAVVILTYNEEANIAQALESVAKWAGEIHILDSLSTDQTLEIARRYPCHIAQHKFENYGKQRNYALENLPIQSEWILFLDADEWLPESLKQEIACLITGAPQENGFYISRRLIWMGKWIRRGYYPTWILRLFRYRKARCEDRTVNEHMVVEGVTGRLKNDFMHEDRKSISDWIAKHNRYATAEALEHINARAVPNDRELGAQPFGTPPQQKRWLRIKVWNRLPPLFRPLLYFIYCFILRGGFLDGRAAFIFHFLHGLWYPMLTDIKYLEILAKSKARDSGVI